MSGGSTPATRDVRTATEHPEVHYHVSHRTRYEYAAPMSDGYTVAYVIPRPTPHQVVERATVAIVPEPDERLEHIDSFGNRVLQFGVHHQHSELTVDATSDVIVEPMTVTSDGPRWETAADAVLRIRGGEALAVRPFAGGRPMLTDDDDKAALHRFVTRSFTPRRPIVDAARAFCHDIYSTFEYDPSFTDVSTPLPSVLAARRGVCQDFAHLAVSGLRDLGLAARYVSGYIETTRPDGTERLVGADASHAWCSVWVPDLDAATGDVRGTWIDFDPTNDHLPVHRHVTVAWGRDYDDVAPVRGVVIGPGAAQTLSVAVHVRRR